MNRINIIKNAKSIKMKILYSFIVFLLIVWGYAAYNYFQNEKYMENSQDIINQEVNILSMAYELSNSIDGRLAAARGYVLTGDSNYKNMFASYSQQALEIQQSLQQYEDFKDIEKTVSDAIEWSTIIQNDVFPLYDQGDIDSAIAMLVSLDTRGNAIYSEYETFAQMKDTEIKDRGNILANDMNSTKMILLILSHALTVIALVLGFYVSNNISKPITRLMNRIESISNGNLSHKPLKITSNDEVARLTVATNAMNDQLKEIVTNIQDGASTVTESSNNLKVAAHEVTNGMIQTTEAVEQIADGTEAQASSASDLRSIMQTFTHNVESANENSLKVQTHSESVQVMTENGQKLINDTEQQMYKIDTIVRQAVNRVEGLNNQTREITQ
ncbi:MAG: methyl-accepting chemotaxis protein, partial [Lysinibacillus sp.]